MLRSILAILCVASLLGCQRAPSEPAPAPAPPRTVWDALPPAATAWGVVELGVLRADERFAPIIAAIGSEAGSGTFETALGRADRLLVHATDAFFSDRVHVLEGDWDANALHAELTATDAATGAMTPVDLGDDARVYVRDDAPWVIGTDGGALLLTGPRDSVEAALRAGRRGTRPRALEGTVATARWAPPELVRGALARRVGRPELATPVAGLEEAELSVSVGAGVDLALTTRFVDSTSAEAGQAALAAVLAVAAADLAPERVASWTDGLTLERQEATVRAWWEFDRAAVSELLALASPLLPTGSPP